ncbi:MAG: M23 family metallopeptidase [bacterium]|nr:M23 family metallopeptidase [bacterium]
MTIEVFPVELVPIPREQAVTRTRAGTTRRCPHDRIWYADWHESRRGRHKHHAQDIFAPIGSRVLAPEAGRVAATRETPRGGHSLKLEVLRRDGAVLRTYYFAHLHEAPMVTDGDMVPAGEPLGLVGRSGNATRTCPHLHISARRYSGGRKYNIYQELVAKDPTLGALAVVS